MSTTPAAGSLPQTIVDTLEQRVHRMPHVPAFFIRTTEGEWHPIDWRSYADRVDRLARALLARGLVRGNRIAICAHTSLEWDITQMAAWRVGASVVGLDANYRDDLLADLIDELDVVALVVQDAAVLNRISLSVQQGLMLILAMNEDPAGLNSIRSVRELSTSDTLPVSELPHLLPTDEALVAFSSGTTSTPTPVSYRHDQLSIAVGSILEAFSDIHEGSVLVCWLPLANLFQRMINLAAMARGATTYIVEDPRSVMDHLRVANPHVFIGVPRFFEQVYAGVAKRIEASPKLSASIARWAVSMAKRQASDLRCGRRPALANRLLVAAADHLVLRAIRANFGSNLRYFISGSAPMPRWLLEWFEAIGLPVLEAYGVTENIVPIAVNRFAVREFGTVGKPLPVHEVRLAEDGEILVRGPGVALRIRQPSPAMDRTDAGFLNTGDLGVFDTNGFLRITGRKADLFKTSAGRWVVPAEIEGRVSRLPYVEHVVALGTRKNVVIALVAINAGYSAADEAASRQEAPSGGPVMLVTQSNRYWKLCRDVADELADMPSHQKPAGLIVVFASAFSITGGQLTTNLKVRRTQIAMEFASAIDRLQAAIDDLVADATTQRPFVVVDVSGVSASERYADSRGRIDLIQTN